MNKYYNKDILDEVNVFYGTRQSGKTYYEYKKLTNLSSDELKWIENTKYIASNLKDEDKKILIKIILGDKYNKFIELIKMEM